MNIRVRIEPIPEVQAVLQEQDACQHEFRLAKIVSSERETLSEDTIQCWPDATFEIICVKCREKLTKKMIQSCPRCLEPLEWRNLEDLARYLPSHEVDHHYHKNMVAQPHHCASCGLTVITAVRSRD